MSPGFPHRFWPILRYTIVPSPAIPRFVRLIDSPLTPGSILGPAKMDPLLNSTVLVVTILTVLLSNGSIFAGPSIEPGVNGESISRTNRGIAGDGTIVYLSIGQNRSVKPGDIFIVYRDVETDFDRRGYGGYAVAGEIKKFKGHRRA